MAFINPQMGQGPTINPRMAPNVDPRNAWANSFSKTRFPTQPQQPQMHMSNPLPPVPPAGLGTVSGFSPIAGQGQYQKAGSMPPGPVSAGQSGSFVPPEANYANAGIGQPPPPGSPVGVNPTYPPGVGQPRPTATSARLPMPTQIPGYVPGPPPGYGLNFS